MSIDYANATLEEIRDHVVADGVVDHAEVEGLRTRLLADGVIDRNEANLLFDINDATTGNSGHAPEWQKFFVESICSHLLNDENSPNQVDAEESSWLVARIESDGQIDDNERALLQAIKATASEVNEALQNLMASHGV